MPNLLGVFNRQETFDDAFTWDHTQIKAFFNRVWSNPDLYNVEFYSRETLGSVINTINTLMDQYQVYLTSPIPVCYQDTYFQHNTLFDLIGWVFSVTGTSPDGANEWNYYYPLTALYAQFCLLACGDGTSLPQVVQLTYFQQGNQTRAAVGATLGDIHPPSNKENARMNRVDKMCSVDLVFDDEKYTSYVVTVNRRTGQETYGQLFGHCGESWPFLYVQSIQDQVDLTGARGWASKTTCYADDDDFEYDDETQDAVVNSIIPPCKNCEVLIDRLGLDPDNFKRPKQDSNSDSDSAEICEKCGAHISMPSKKSAQTPM